MKLSLKSFVAAAAAIAAISSVALGWWDTQVRAQKPEPLVAEYPSVEHAPQDADIRQDAQADGGRGGQVVYLQPGEGLTVTVDVERSVYSMWIIARADEDEFNPPAEPEQIMDLPGGQIRVPWPRQPVYSFLEIEGADGQSRRWYMPITYRTDYTIASKLYFPVHVDGEYNIRVGFDERSEIGLIVDRVELRDVLGHTAKTAAKTQRMLTSEDELLAIRANFLANNSIEGWRSTPRDIPRAPMAQEERLARNERLWAVLPDWNIVEGDPTHGYRHGSWNQAVGGSSWNQRTGFGIAGSADVYEATGCVESAWDGAVLLAAMAEKYPGLDFFYIGLGGAGSGQNVPGNFRQQFPYQWGSWYGKWEYSGWAPSRLSAMVEGYDKLFDFIQDNQALADYVGTKIPWVTTPEDVVELIDIGILQHGMDALNRRILRNDRLSVLIPLVQGVNEVSHEMLETGAFKRVHYNMADAGGLDDQAFASFNRGGVHYIGATGYVGTTLADLAVYLRMYREAGGDPRFDLSDPNLYPQMAEAERTVEGLRAAGGFPIVIGDSMDLRRGREANVPEHPSRVIEGFGAAILEDGQGQANPLIKRAAAIRTGIGRGHAHQDTLNLEMFAHGTRLAPDLGGRHAGSNRARPNMRTNRMHNLVEIDQREFHNPYPGSTTGATGWTTGFSPQPGAQYMANAARATSHPDVSLYQRSTAMIDGPADGLIEQPVYLFDVFRVDGGSTHTYSFHGQITDDNQVESNFPLRPATSERALGYMYNRPEETRVEGEAPAVMEVTWMLQQELQRNYQGARYQPDKPVGITLTLLGSEGDHVMIGGAESAVYPVEMPYLHVQRRSDDPGMKSVYPALYEAHAGGRFLSEQRALAVTPQDDSAERGVGVSVRVGEDRVDTLFSSLKPEITHELENGARAAGEFGYISQDADGLRMMHLVGGTELSLGGIGVRVERAAWQATIEAVDYPNHLLTLSNDVPEKLLDGAIALLGNDLHWSEFELSRAGGRNATVVRTPRYYQSSIEMVDEANGLITTELEPMVYGSDTMHTHGTTIANEAHNRFWRSHAEPVERWMYLGWPGTRLSYPDVMLEEDLVDADGDGRRVVSLIAGRPIQTPPGDDVVLEMEVTRVDPAENLFYFKMPENPDYQLGGWQFVRRAVVNEDKSVTWVASYPGTSFSWKVEEGEMSRDDLLIPGTDELGKLYAYHFGPGDSFRVQSFVHVTRVAPGEYEVRANTPCEITLPVVGEASISVGGAGYQAIASERVGDATRISLGVDQLGEGLVRIRVAR